MEHRVTMAGDRDRSSIPVTEPRSREVALSTARRQLRRVLVWLGLLDAGVLVVVVSLAEARQSLGLSASGFLLAVLGGVGLILATRLMMAVRLRRRSGELG